MQTSENKSFFWLITTCLLLLSSLSFGQSKTRKFSTVINHPSLNVFSPAVSADGNAIVFVSDNAQDGVLTPFYSFKEGGDWKEPQLFPKSIYSRLNSLNSFHWSADGKKLYFSTLKSPGVGGFDIWSVDWNGSRWGEPVNPGLPVNTQGHEGFPSVSADGTVLYFTRCAEMDQNNARGCKIFQTTKKPNGQWGEPVELPANINTGNSQTPKIMADGETLIFSSDMIKPSKGGFDLYTSTLVNGKWTNPKPYDFANTEKNDQHISITALGRYLIRDTPGAKRNEIVEYLIPDDLRPRGMMKVDGKVLGASGEYVPCYISVVDLTKNQRVFSGRSYQDGTFVLYLKEGSRYDLSIDGEQDNLTFFSKLIDLSGDRIPQSEKVNAVLKKPENGDEIPLYHLKFKEHSSNLSMKDSENELTKIARMVKSNPRLFFELEVSLKGFTKDTIYSEGLTETIVDSVKTQLVIGVDSLGESITMDTIKTITWYHNDRTEAQAKTIIKSLVDRGVSESNLGYITSREEVVLPEERDVKILLRVKAMPTQ